MQPGQPTFRRLATVRCATDLAFGGPALERLCITSSRHSVPLDTLGSAPLSGRLLEWMPS